MDTKDLQPIREHVDAMTADIDVWADRQEPDARARRYASAAVNAIDAAIAELHAIRARLITEIRAADDATNARADQLLAETRPAAGAEADAADVPPPVVMDAYREATRHHWSQPPALEGYGYILPEDYLRGGAQ